MNTILEVAIGLLFVFLLFSLLVSAVNEAIFGHLAHLRSRVLEDSLQALLSNRAGGFSAVSQAVRSLKSIAALFQKDQTEAGSTGFANTLLSHPSVRGLAVGKRRCPSYLPAETFVDAVVGTLLGLGSSKADGPPAQALDKIGIGELASALNKLPDANARMVLSSVLAGSTDLTDARRSLEIWFNNSMERVSGVYKRYTQFWLYVWATATVVWLNVDTLEIGRRLLADAQFRTALTAGATSFVAQTNIANAFAAAESNRLPPAIASMSDTNSPTAQTNPGPAVVSAGQLLQEISTLNLSLGWGPCTNGSATHSVIGWLITHAPRLEQDAPGTNTTVRLLLGAGFSAPAPCPATAQAWGLKLLGLVITIAAISQGAPFWFDLLNRLTNLRAAGRPPEVKKKSSESK